MLVTTARNILLTAFVSSALCALAWPRVVYSSQAGDAAVAAAKLYNMTGSTSDQRCRELFGQAFDSLGFSAPDAIRAGDYLFCGRYYLAWIDNTGFYGELNGLWQVNGLVAESLNFVFGPDGALRNMLIAGENRNGLWPSGYSGSVHIEVGSHTPEDGNLSPDDDDTCPGTFPGDLCNGYALNEAGNFTRAGIPWWTACNSGSPSFTQVFLPSEESVFGSTQRNLKLVYRAALTKESDNDAVYNGDFCHGNWLFPDGVRRPLYLRTGWELYGDAPFLVNTYQAENGANNPPPGGHAYVIHALTTTSLQNPPPGKDFKRWIQPSVDRMTDPEGGCPSKFFPADQFTFNGDSICFAGEHPFGEAATWTVSSVNGRQRGRTFTTWQSYTDPISHQMVIERDNQVCECLAHDGFELNGGLVDEPNGEMFNLPAGQLTKEHRYNVLLATESCNHFGRLVAKGSQDQIGGTDTLRMNVTFDAPSDLAGRNPAVTGAWLTLRAATGETLHKIRIPPGYYSPGGRGWYIRHLPGTPVRWTYVAAAGSAIDGIEKLTVNFRNSKYSLKVTGRNARYQLPFSLRPFRMAFSLDDTPQAAEAACAEMTMWNCSVSLDGADVKCLRQRGEDQ